jgi:hypothetical protein
MSGFARLESSLPIIGDIGLVWPILGYKVAEKLGVDLEFLSHPQDTDQGQELREWIVNNVEPFSREKLNKRISKWRD